jgi:hypothetical protein
MADGINLIELLGEVVHYRLKVCRTNSFVSVAKYMGEKICSYNMKV